jgi:hypothetical protein
MAYKIASKPWEMIPRPPTGWRKAIPLAIKLQVIINQKGLGPDNSPLDAMVVGVHFDHRPPLHEREYDAERDETIPAANDVRFIVALPIPAHREISKIDIKRFRKTQRQHAAENAFRSAMETKRLGQKRVAKCAIRSRKFSK